MKAETLNAEMKDEVDADADVRSFSILAVDRWVYLTKSD